MQSKKKRLTFRNRPSIILKGSGYTEYSLKEKNLLIIENSDNKILLGKISVVICYDVSFTV